MQITISGDCLFFVLVQSYTSAITSRVTLLSYHLPDHITRSLVFSSRAQHLHPDHCLAQRESFTSASCWCGKGGGREDRSITGHEDRGSGLKREKGLQPRWWQPRPARHSRHDLWRHHYDATALLFQRQIDSFVIIFCPFAGREAT